MVQDIITKEAVLKWAETNSIVNMAIEAYPNDWCKAMMAATICLAQQNEQLGIIALSKLENFLPKLTIDFVSLHPSEKKRILNYFKQK